MADKKNANSEKTVVTRITATDSTQRAKKTEKTTDKAKSVAKTEKSPKVSKVKADKLTKKPTNNPFIALGRYFKGAWQELRLVHWPTRRATWSMTGAVLVFSAIFSALILLLDAGFQLLFEQILQ